MTSSAPFLDKAKCGPWAVIAGGSDGTGACFAREIDAFGEPPEESERQTAARRDRVLAVEKISQSFFGDH